MLLEYRADPNAKDKLESTPLHNAARGKNPVVARLLLESGADPEASDQSGSTPLHYAEEEIAPALLGIEVAHPKQVT